MSAIKAADLRAEGIEPGSLEHAVACLLGPHLVGEPVERRQQQALEIAVAALRLAGHADLEAKVQAELP